MVFCAASLDKVVQSLVAEHDLKVDLQLGGSRTLARQARAGAPADLLLLADDNLAQGLKASTDRPPRTFAGNRLVLIASSSTAPDLPMSKATLAVADPDSAPLGAYTRAVLSDLEDFRSVVPLKDAGAVLAAVALGHTDYGIVYGTDTLKSDRVRVAREFSSDEHRAIRYQAFLLEEPHPEAARLYGLLLSKKGEVTLREAGFSSP